MTVRKALVPMAGLGTRFFPASHAFRKEFFPLVGPDGGVRPILHYQLRDLVRAGFREIGVIVRPGDDALVRDYFAGPDEAGRRGLAGRPGAAEELAEMAAILDCLHFVVQERAEGFGHAVFQARAFVREEPFLLCTGDLLYRGDVRRRLVEAFAFAGGRSVSGVCPIGAERLHGYGTIGGRRLPGTPGLIEITRLVEKPTVERARAELRVEGLPPDTWLGWFGLHLFTPGIFDVLGAMIRADDREAGEFQLTRAQDRLRAREGYLALELPTPDRFDFGLPGEFLANQVAFAAGGDPLPRASGVTTPGSPQ